MRRWPFTHGRLPPSDSDWSPLTRLHVVIMWWTIGIGGAILYLIVAVTLGLMTLRNGHGWMFFFGIFFPVFWVIGAFLRRTGPAAAV